jgi:predicted RNase H-like HicB family nuclease
MVKYTIIIEKANGNYSAYCPDLPGVIATGQTKEKTVENMRDAIQFHLEGLKRENLAIPKPSTHATDIDISL